MDDRLFKRLEKIEESISRLRKVEEQFLYLDAHKKVLFSQLFMKAEGKNNAEKEAFAYASQDWVDFVSGLVKAETNFNHERRMYELRLKAYDAEHLTFKNEAPAIKRQGA